MKPELIIKVDVHESDSNILEAIIDRGMEATQEHMETSDVSLEYDGFKVGIELKRNQDYTKSLYEGRLKDQICRLHDHFDFQVLIVEGWKPFISNSDDEHTLRDKVKNHEKSLRTINRRLTVYETQYQEDTVEIIWEIARDLKKGSLQSLSRPILIEAEIGDSVKLLCSLPHVSRERALTLLKEFGSPYEAFKRLSEWPGLKRGLTEDRVERIKKAYEGE